MLTMLTPIILDLEFQCEALISHLSPKGQVVHGQKLV